MTYNEKKSLYESIMMDIAKVVKRKINESDLISKIDAEEISRQEEDSRESDIASYNRKWDEFFNKHPQLKGNIENIKKRLLEKKLDEFTKEDFYNPQMNRTFYNMQPEQVIIEGNKIGFIITIKDEDDNYLGEYKMIRNTMGDAIKAYTIAAQSAVVSKNDTFYDLTISSFINSIFKVFNNKLSDDEQDEIDERIREFYYKVINDATSAKDIINGMKRYL